MGGGVRVRLQAEQLDWVPGLLAGLGPPFMVEGPELLHGLVRARAQRLIAGSRQSERVEGGPAGK